MLLSGVKLSLGCSFLISLTPCAGNGGGVNAFVSGDVLAFFEVEENSFQTQPSSILS